MSAIWFWILMLLWLVFGGFYTFRTGGDRLWGGVALLLFLLFLVLGWQVFGSPMKG